MERLTKSELPDGVVEVWCGAKTASTLVVRDYFSYADDETEQKRRQHPMTNKHIETLHMMQIRYSHIRKNDMEWEAIEAAINAIRQHLAADVAEVVHAHWITIEGPNADRNISVQCSHCFHGDEHATTTTVPYCWFCGAKMDGERKGGADYE